MEGTWQEPGFFPSISSPWKMMPLASSLTCAFFSSSFTMYMRRKIFDYLHRVPRVVMPAKMRNEAFVANYFLHGCLLLICINVTCQDFFLCYALLKSHDLVLCIWLLREEESLKMGHFVQLANFQHPRTRLFWLGLFFDLTSKKSSVMRIWFWILDATFEWKLDLIEALGIFLLASMQITICKGKTSGLSSKQKKVFLLL